MTSVTVTSKGQITISARYEFIAATRLVTALKGMFGSASKTVSVEPRWPHMESQHGDRPQSLCVGAQLGDACNVLILRINGALPGFIDALDQVHAPGQKCMGLN